MAKSGRRPSEIFAEKQNRLNWERFNFLENLLVFCTKEDLKDKDQNVKFQIGKAEDKQELCLLFKTDREGDSLFGKQAGKNKKEPDRLVLYASKALRIFTIIEMKGGKNGFKDALEQIVNLKNRLKDEADAHLPTKLKIKYQAVILGTRLADVSPNDLWKLHKNGLTIIPLISPQGSLELYPYISKLNHLDERYQHQKLSHRVPDSVLHKTFACQSLPDRIQDSFYQINFDRRKKVEEREGLYLNALQEKQDDDYVVLKLDRQGYKIGIQAKNEGFLEQIKGELKNLGLVNVKIEIIK